MSRLTERYIQNKSLEYLEFHYKEEHNLTKIFSAKEVRTNSNRKKKYGRADGLLCFNSDKQKYHTVSLEAKSHKTLYALYPQNNFISKNILPISAFLLSFSTSYLILSKWYWAIIISLIFTLLIYIILEITIDYYKIGKLQTANVIKQIKRYPANEQWIALSKDSIKLLNEDQYSISKNFEKLKSVCNKKNIGLLTVSSKATEILLEPKYKKGNFLSKYSKEKEIKDYLKTTN